MDIENNAWFVAFTPYDDPQIAIVAYIPNGYKGALAGSLIRDVVAYYFEANKTAYTDDMPLPNTLLP